MGFVTVFFNELRTPAKRTVSFFVHNAFRSLQLAGGGDWSYLVSEASLGACAMFGLSTLCRRRASREGSPYIVRKLSAAGNPWRGFVERSELCSRVSLERLFLLFSIVFALCSMSADLRGCPHFA